MSTTATTKEKAMSFLPTGAEALGGVKDLGGLATGMITAHALVTLLKKDTVIVNAGIALVGLGVGMKVNNPLVKMIGLGAAAYGTIKLVNSLTKEVAAPGTAGLNGILPENVKSAIRKFLPTLSGMDEFAGSHNDSDDMRGTDEVINNLSLDDVSVRNEFAGHENQAMEGLGEAIDLAA